MRASEALETSQQHDKRCDSLQPILDRIFKQILGAANEGEYKVTVSVEDESKSVEIIKRLKHLRYTATLLPGSGEISIYWGN